MFFADVLENINAAEKTVLTEGSFADDRCLLSDQLFCHSDHLPKVTVRNFRIGTEKTHGKITDFIAGVKNSLIQI